MFIKLTKDLENFNQRLAPFSRLFIPEKKSWVLLRTVKLVAVLLPLLPSPSPQLRGSIESHQPHHHRENHQVSSHVERTGKGSRPPKPRSQLTIITWPDGSFRENPAYRPFLFDLTWSLPIVSSLSLGNICRKESGQLFNTGTYCGSFLSPWTGY